MKRVLGIVLGSAMALAGCSEEDAAVKSKSFTGDYDLGIYLVSAGKISSETKTYVDFDGKVTQIDSLASNATTTATSGVCQLHADAPITVSQSEVSATTIVRIAGQQNVFLLPGTYYPENNDEVNWNSPDSSNYDNWSGQPGVHVWGDPSYGDIFFNDPKLDIWVYKQAEADCNCKLDNYLKTVPVTMHIIEQDYEATVVDTDTFTDVDDSVTVTEVNHGIHLLWTYVRFVLDGFVWETGTFDDLYTNNSVDYEADMLLPDNVEVGDTWLNNDGNLVAAVAVEAVEIGGKNVRALHIVERGSTDLDLTANGVKGWCLDFYDSRHQDNDGTITVGKNVERKSACSSLGDDINTGNGTGWTNIRHSWYYKGLRVKIVEERVNISVDDYGFVAGNDGNLPSADDGTSNVATGGGVAVGDCALLEGEVTGDEDQIARLKPYARFSVEKRSETWQATEIRDNATIVTQYKEEKAAAAK